MVSDPLELRQLFNKLGDYYCWFVILSKVKIGVFHDNIKGNLSYSCCVDGLKRHTLARKRSLSEIMIWCENIPEEVNFDIDDENNSLSEIINLFYRIYKIIQIDNENYGDIDDGFQNHVYNNLLYADTK